MSSLAEPAKKTLLDVARRAVILAVERGKLLENLPIENDLQQAGGAFVTLHRLGRLRGCVGQLTSGEPLISVVAYCATAAALEDPRFAPMCVADLTGIEIEISVLSPLVEITLEQIESGTHGLLISRDGRRGVLLPQVAQEYGWTAERFLEETCAKAGLDCDAWKHPRTRIQAFTAEVFSEMDFGAEPAPKRRARAKPGYSISM